jgi:hypothetical protein
LRSPSSQKHKFLAHFEYHENDYLTAASRAKERMNTEGSSPIDSIQSLAEFWGIQNLPRIEDELESVTEPVLDEKNLDQNVLDQRVLDQKVLVQIHLQSTAVESIHQIAQSQGVQDTDLIQEWVLERIDQEL